jgi:hypothetical protein
VRIISYHLIARLTADYDKELSIIGLSNVLTSLAGMGLTGHVKIWVHVCCDQCGQSMLLYPSRLWCNTSIPMQAMAQRGGRETYFSVVPVPTLICTSPESNALILQALTFSH